MWVPQCIGESLGVLGGGLVAYGASLGLWGGPLVNGGCPQECGEGPWGS